MSDGEQDPNPKPAHDRRRILLTGLVMVLIAASAGTAGWWLALLHDAAVRAESVEVARQRCQQEITDKVLDRPEMSASLDSAYELKFSDVFLVGTNEGDGLMASIEGEAHVVTSEGKKFIHEYQCTFYGYDADDHSWGATAWGIKSSRSTLEAEIPKYAPPLLR